MTEKRLPLLTVNNLSVKFNNKPILRDINFQIRDIVRDNCTQGQVVCIIAQSGKGKTTLFNCLAGMLKPNTGEIKVDDTQFDTHIGEMGVVFQDYFIYPWRKINKTLKKAVKKNSKVKKEDRQKTIEEIAKEFNFLEHLDKFPSQLSGGQKQRVAIAEQLLIGSDFLLLDEPFSGLDVITIDKVIATLKKVSILNEKKTIIIVSHDLSNSVALSDTVYVLNTQEGKEGATIVKEIDLIALDLAWHENVKDDPKFKQVLKDIKQLMA